MMNAPETMSECAKQDYAGIAFTDVRFMVGKKSDDQVLVLFGASPVEGVAPIRAIVEGLSTYIRDAVKPEMRPAVLERFIVELVDSVRTGDEKKQFTKRYL